MSLAAPFEHRASHLVVAFAAAMISGCRRESRSKQEALAAMAEVRGLLNSASGSPATTQIGRKLELLSQSANELQKELRARLSLIDADALLMPERLSTSAGIERSMADAEALKRIDRWYFNQVEQLLLDFDLWALQQFGRSLGDQTKMRLEARELLERSVGVHESIAALIRFVQSASPTLKDGVLIFRTKGECVRYEALLKAIETRNQMLESHQIELLRRRHASMN